MVEIAGSGQQRRQLQKILLKKGWYSRKINIIGVPWWYAAFSACPAPGNSTFGLWFYSLSLLNCSLINSIAVLEGIQFKSIVAGSGMSGWKKNRFTKKKKMYESSESKKNRSRRSEKHIEKDLAGNAIRAGKLCVIANTNLTLASSTSPGRNFPNCKKL